MSNAEELPLKCQNCRLPLKIDSSLLDLSLAQRDLLANSSNEYTPTKYKIPDDRLHSLSRAIHPKDLNLPKSELDSYVFLQAEPRPNSPSNDSSIETSAQTLIARKEDDSGDEHLDEDFHYGVSHGNTRTLSTQISALANVFNILSSNSNIDYPVCQDCCNVLIQRLQSEYDDAIRERDLYTQFLSRIEKQKKVTQPDSTGAIHEESAKLKSESESLLNELVSLEKQDEELDKKIADLEKQVETKRITELEELKRKNMHELAQINFSTEVQSLKKQYEFSLNSLDRLRKFNVYNETFKISHEGPFGVINGLRLGGFDEVRVPWQEINAALGQIVLLLATIVTRLNIKTKGYKLQPMGSFSKVCKFQQEEQEWETYEAYFTDGFKLGKLFRKETGFDKALECLLDIVQLMAAGLSRSPSGTGEVQADDSDAAGNENDAIYDVELPYVMHKDKINGISVKLFGSKPTLEWTTAMKFLLTNAKWLLAFSSSRLAQSPS